MTSAANRRWSQQEAAAWKAGDIAVRSLREALERVGVVIPSLRAGMPVNSKALVELGGVNAGTATRLAEIINEAADQVPDLRAAPRR